jgi:hypothetical protein
LGTSKLKHSGILLTEGDLGGTATLTHIAHLRGALTMARQTDRSADRRRTSVTAIACLCAVNHQAERVALGVLETSAS